MSEIIVVAYADRDQATAVIDAINRLDPGWVDVNEIIAVSRDRKGKLRVSEPGQPFTGRSMPWRALWRALLQTSTAPHANGTDSRCYLASSVGIPERFVNGARKMIEKGDSALIAWVRTSVPAGVRDHLRSPGHDVLRAPLTVSQDTLLHSVLDVLGPLEGGRI